MKFNVSRSVGVAIGVVAFTFSLSSNDSVAGGGKLGESGSDSPRSARLSTENSSKRLSIKSRGSWAGRSSRALSTESRRVSDSRRSSREVRDVRYVPAPPPLKLTELRPAHRSEAKLVIKGVMPRHLTYAASFGRPDTDYANAANYNPIVFMGGVGYQRSPVTEEYFNLENPRHAYRKEVFEEFREQFPYCEFTYFQDSDAVSAELSPRGSAFVVDRIHDIGARNSFEAELFPQENVAGVNINRLVCQNIDGTSFSQKDLLMISGGRLSMHVPSLSGF